MSPAKSILIGATLIAASILFVNSIHPAEAQYAAGPYQMVHHSNALANSSVFRMNTATGEISYCYVPGGVTSTDVTCTKPVR
jgi:hypothetical protein